MANDGFFRTLTNEFKPESTLEDLSIGNIIFEQSVVPEPIDPREIAKIVCANVSFPSP
jgi:hypothetical protein